MTGEVALDQNGAPARRSEPDWRKEGAYRARSTRRRLLRAFDACREQATARRSKLQFRVAPAGQSLLALDRCRAVCSCLLSTLKRLPNDSQTD
jgi:hypothetical protein